VGGFDDEPIELLERVSVTRSPNDPGQPSCAFISPEGAPLRGLRFHEQWLVNVLERRVEASRETSPEGYRQTTRCRSATLSLQDFADVRLEIAGVC